MIYIINNNKYSPLKEGLRRVFSSHHEGSIKGLNRVFVDPSEGLCRVFLPEVPFSRRQENGSEKGRLIIRRFLARFSALKFSDV